MTTLPGQHIMPHGEVEAEPNFRTTLREDLAAASTRDKIIALGTLGLSAADLPLHEAILGNVAGRVFDSTHSILQTGMIDGLASFGIEGAIGAGVVVTAQAMPKVTRHIANRIFSKKKGFDETAVGSLKEDAKFLFWYGNGPYEFKQSNSVEIESTKRGLLKSTAAAGYLGSLNFALFSGISKLVLVGEQHPGIVETGANDIARDSKNELIWLGIVAARIFDQKYGLTKSAGQTLVKSAKRIFLNPFGQPENSVTDESSISNAKHFPKKAKISLELEIPDLLIKDSNEIVDNQIL